jgi:hypothetical protein
MNGRTAGLGVALIAAAGGALGQGQKADGRKLDANQQIGSGGINASARADYSAELALRTAIVTGNAPNGLSFRGDVGYTSPREFRGDLGSDDLFEFRRDSVYSGLSGLGLRGTDALQYQFALTAGSSPPRSLAGALTVARDTFVPVGVPELTRPGGPAGGGAAGLSGPLTRVDPDSYTDLSGAGLWKLRSASGYLADRSLAQTLVGSIPAGEGRTVGVTASPLGGIRAVEPLVSPESALLRDTAGTRRSLAPAANRPLFQDTTTRVDVVTGYDRYVGGVRESFARSLGLRTGESPAADDLTARMEAQNAKLREYLNTVRAQGAEPLVTEGLGDAGVEQSTIDALREGGARIDRLIEGTPGVERNFYVLHMTEGRSRMAEADFFQAEARFSMALSIREGDATASIARVHAQLGAGLFLSASVNLRETLSAHPLLIGAGYAPDLIPAPDRLGLIAERLRGQAPAEGASGRSAALLLAYVGHHLGRNDLVAEGLDRLDADGEDRLSRVLRLVWLSERGVGEALDEVDAGAPGGE